MRITAKDNLRDWVSCDEIIPEPAGGAHHDHEAAAALLDEVLQKHLTELKKMPVQQLLDARYNKFRNMAQFYTRFKP